MTPDIDHLLAHHVTVRFPRIDASPELPRTLPHRLLLSLHLGGIRIALAPAGHHRSLYRIVRDRDGRWQIDLFLAEPDAGQVVADSTRGAAVELTRHR